MAFVSKGGGKVSVKNFARPTRFGRWPPSNSVGRGTAPAVSAPTERGIVPSLVVLPFQNMSGDAEQEYFADGIVEDLTTALSRFSTFAVISRNSAFVYKGRPIDVRQVGRDLAVRYVLEGSVRRAGKQVRVGAQLIDASTSAHIWAQKFDGTIEDI